MTSAGLERPNPELPVQTAAVDSHCHLFLIDREPAEVLDEARAAGVGTVVCPGIDPGSSRRAVELAESFPGVFATAGMHPHDAASFDVRAAAAIEELLANPQVVAVGECGLDFYRMRSPREDQERTFRAHIRLARQTGLPLVVHVRDAWTRILELLAEGSAERVVLHSPATSRPHGSAREGAGSCRSPGTSRIRRTPICEMPPPRSPSTASSSRPTAPSSRRTASAAARTRPRTSST